MSAAGAPLRLSLSRRHAASRVCQAKEVPASRQFGAVWEARSGGCNPHTEGGSYQKGIGVTLPPTSTASCIQSDPLGACRTEGRPQCPQRMQAASCRGVKQSRHVHRGFCAEGDWSLALRQATPCTELRHLVSCGRCRAGAARRAGSAVLRKGGGQAHEQNPPHLEDHGEVAHNLAHAQQLRSLRAAGTALSFLSSAVDGAIRWPARGHIFRENMPQMRQAMPCGCAGLTGVGAAQHAQHAPGRLRPLRRAWVCAARRRWTLQRPVSPHR